ncbi:MAG: hypothetical protein JXR26_03070 [Balneolaceae bacterium]|nr:hypothetical protein [Balneolaceae bacterium]
MKNLFTKYISVVFLVFSVMAVAACSGNTNKENASDTSKMDETEATTNTQSANTQQITAQSETANKTVDGKLNINTASGEAFRTIPNVGDKMVHEFEEYRPYVSIQQFRKEIGKYVDEDQVAEYENYIYVPIDPNNSDIETIMQIPGLDEDEANELISMRPFDNNPNPSFIGAMQPMVSGEELEIAKGYLKTEG